jgi:hypothetical protein
MLRTYVPQYRKRLHVQPDQAGNPCLMLTSKTSILRDPSAHASWLTRPHHASLLEDATILFVRRSISRPKTAPHRALLRLCSPRVVSCRVTHFMSPIVQRLFDITNTPPTLTSQSPSKTQFSHSNEDYVSRTQHGRSMAGRSRVVHLGTRLSTLETEIYVPSRANSNNLLTYNKAHLPKRLAACVTFYEILRVA